MTLERCSSSAFSCCTSISSLFCCLFLSSSTRRVITASRGFSKPAIFLLLSQNNQTYVLKFLSKLLGLHEKRLGLLSRPSFLFCKFVGMTREFRISGWQVLFPHSGTRRSARSGFFSFLLPLFLVRNALPSAHGRLFDVLYKVTILFTLLFLHLRVYLLIII